ncbi:MAG: hypothetical protein ACW9XH_06885 [Candidatus Nitrosopumilus sp. bin_32a]
MNTNEKTMELNLTAEILQGIRRTNPNAYANGFTIRNEKKHGLDVSFGNVNSNHMTGIQFKAAKSHRSGIYRFEINNNTENDQHLKLFYYAMYTVFFPQLPKVFYFFPLIHTVDELESESPNYLSETYVFSPLSFSRTILNREKHDVRINNRTGNISVSSKEETQVTHFIKGKEAILNLVNKDTKAIKEYHDFELYVLESILSKTDKEELRPDEEKSYGYIQKIITKKWNLNLPSISLNSQVNGVPNL